MKETSCFFFNVKMSTLKTTISTTKKTISSINTKQMSNLPINMIFLDCLTVEFREYRMHMLPHPSIERNFSRDLNIKFCDYQENYKVSVKHIQAYGMLSSAKGNYPNN